MTAAAGRRARLGPAATALAAVLGFGLVAFVAGFAVFAATLAGSSGPQPRHAEGIVALTGGADRVAAAFGLLARGAGDRLLVSGVNPATSAADLVREAPDAADKLACCVELGRLAADTVGNARETRAWVRRHGIQTLIVVTSDYHMPRALAEIADAVPGTDLVPFAVAGDRPRGPREAFKRLRLEAAEYVKYLVVLARTHLRPSAASADRATPPALRPAATVG